MLAAARHLLLHVHVHHFLKVEMMGAICVNVIASIFTRIFAVVLVVILRESSTCVGSQAYLLESNLGHLNIEFLVGSGLVQFTLCPRRCLKEGGRAESSSTDGQNNQSVK